MTGLYQSLKYPLRYKGYLVVVIVCVLVGGLCYGGGIGTIYPIMKIIISPEGPQGAAEIGLAEDMLGVALEVDDFSADTEVELDKVEPGSPAAKLGLKARDIIRQVDGQDVYLPGFVRLISTKKPSERTQLQWVNKEGEQLQGYVQLDRAGLDSRILARLSALLPRGRDKRFDALLYIMIVFWLINMLQFAMRFVQDFCAGVMIERGLLDLRTRVYRKALSLPLSFYDLQGGSSGVASRFVRDAPLIKRGMKVLFTQTMLEPFKFLVALSLALYCSWRLTLIVLAVAPVVLLLVNRYGRIMKKATRRSLQVWGKILTLLNETLSNIRVVKAYGSEAYEYRRFFRANRRLLKHLIRIARVDALASPTIAMLGVSMATVGLLFACRQALPPIKSMKPSTLFAFFAGIFGMAESLRKLSAVPNKFHAANVAAGRVFALMDHPQAEEDDQTVELGPLSLEIRFENITFTYPQASGPALRQINLVVPRGQTIALVGPNGSGKTTLISLIPRFFEPDSGRLLFDAQDIGQANLRSLRKKIAMVTQETVIFADTVRANIAYGQPRIKLEEIVDAAKRAYADEFIELLPEGYNTVLSEGGQNLSGGQRQRLSIARAILRDPEILILDEATSSIDADSEAKIGQALKEFAADRTCFVVAHRFATVMAADSIVVMDEGKIVARGGHEELMRTCPLYHGLYETQLQHGR